jgi:K+-transporting ATPase c subunit
MHKRIVSTTIVLTLCFGLILGIVSAGSVVAQEYQTTSAVNQTDGSNITSNDGTTSGNATTAEQFENITHGGGPGAGATNQSER